MSEVKAQLVGFKLLAQLLGGTKSEVWSLNVEDRGKGKSIPKLVFGSLTHYLMAKVRLNLLISLK